MPKVALARCGPGDGYSMLRYATELSRALADHAGEGWSFDLHAPSAGQFNPGNAFRRLANFAARYVEYPLAAMAWRADLIHVLDHSYSQVLLGAGRAKVVVTCHDTIPWQVGRGAVPGRLSPWVIRTVIWRLKLMRRADWVVTDSHSTKADVEALVPALKGRVSVVYPGLSGQFAAAELDRGAVRDRYQIGRADTAILSVAGAAVYKNSTGVARAFCILATTEPDLKWLAVGGISEEARRILEDAGLSGRLREVTEITDSELAQIYQASDVLIFPSWYEGFGWPPLEAMACGLPVVASNAGSLPEVLGDAPLMAAPNDPGAIASCASRLLSDRSLRERKITAGLAQARQFTWRRAATELMDLYSALLRTDRHQ